jgi:hypothetical protein
MRRQLRAAVTTKMFTKRLEARFDSVSKDCVHESRDAAFLGCVHWLTVSTQGSPLPHGPLSESGAFEGKEAEERDCAEGVRAATVSGRFHSGPNLLSFLTAIQ